MDKAPTPETKPEFVLKGHTNSLDHVDFCPGKAGAELLTCSHDRTLMVWDLNKQVSIMTMKGHTYSYWKTAFSFWSSCFWHQ
jgi:WD40 repeat protein